MRVIADPSGDFVSKAKGRPGAIRAGLFLPQRGGS
jgi:hypothetical protein